MAYVAMDDTFNFLFAQQQIKERLVKVTGQKSFLQENLAGIKQTSLPPRSTHILYDDYAIESARLDGSSVVITQFWTLFAVVKSDKQTASSSPQDGVGPLLGQVIKAMSNWKPAGVKHVVLTNPRWKPGYIESYGYFPLTFALKGIVI